MCPHGVHTQAFQVPHCSAEADDLCDGRGARLELVRHRVGPEALLGDVEDHLAAAEERRHGVEQLRAGPQHADTGRTAHLVPGEHHEIGAQGTHIGGQVRHVLAGVDADQRAGVMSGGSEPGDRVERAQHVAHGGDRQQLRPVQQTIQIGEVQAAVSGDRDPANLEAPLGGQDVPRHDVGVVLHLGEHDCVRGAQIGAAPRSGNQVHRLGGVLGEHDLIGAGGADEASDIGPGAFHQLCRGCGDLIRAAMDVGVDRAVVVVHRIENGGRLLRRRRRVEVDDRVAVDAALEQRELGLDGPVDVSAGPGDHAAALRSNGS